MHAVGTCQLQLSPAQYEPLVRVPLRHADSATRNVTFELVGKPAEGQAPPLAQQLRGLFTGLKADA